MQETCYQLIYGTAPSPLPPSPPAPASGGCTESSTKHPPGQGKAAAAGALGQPGWAGAGEQADAHQAFKTHL